MTPDLMKHQAEGVDFLLGQESALLAFEQGLGKTLVAIEAFSRLRLRNMADTMLVLCPNSLKRNWRAEVSRFARELSVDIIEGPPRVRRQAVATTRAAVVVISYETARAEVTALLALMERRRCALVLDESHSIKNRRSLTAGAALQLAPAARYRWLLTGTPVTNSPLDLHTQVGVVTLRNPLGSYEAFAADYKDSPTHAQLEALAARVAPFLLRRTKQECLDLPEKTFVDVLVELPGWQRKLYNQMRDELVCEIQSMDGDEYRAFASTALTRLLRLSQLACNPRLILPGEAREPAKLAELEQVVGEITAEPDKKVIVWSHYVATIEELLGRFSEIGAVALYGGVDARVRQDIAAQFQGDPETRVMVANPAAAGTGFTLTAATYAIYESLSWRYDFYAQSQDRNHRIGQQNNVTYIRLIAADTIDEVMAAALERKGTTARLLLGDATGSPRIADMSREQLCDMLTSNRWPG